jgi:hypothetical protein
LYQAKRHGCTISLEKQHKLERSLGYQSNTWEFANSKIIISVKEKGNVYPITCHGGKEEGIEVRGVRSGWVTPQSWVSVNGYSRMVVNETMPLLS